MPEDVRRRRLNGLKKRQIELNCFQKRQIGKRRIIFCYSEITICEREITIRAHKIRFCSSKNKFRDSEITFRYHEIIFRAQ